MDLFGDRQIAGWTNRLMSLNYAQTKEEAARLIEVMRPLASAIAAAHAIDVEYAAEKVERFAIPLLTSRTSVGSKS